MKIIDLVKLTNTCLAGEHLPYQKLLPYFDMVVDDINSRLNATFPSFSSITINSENASSVSYTAFPDKYLREVVAIGAAHKFYLIDEEGIDAASDLGLRYEQNMFFMTRDYIEQIPVYFQSHNSGSVLISDDLPQSVISFSFEDIL